MVHAHTRAHVHAHTHAHFLLQLHVRFMRVCLSKRVHAHVYLSVCVYHERLHLLLAGVAEVVSGILVDVLHDEFLGQSTAGRS